MAQFAPYEKPTAPPSYIGLSKEPPPVKPNLAMGKAFEGLADIFSQAVTGIDEINQQGIEKAAFEGATAATRAEEEYLKEQIQIEKNKGSSSYDPVTGRIISNGTIDQGKVVDGQLVPSDVETPGEAKPTQGGTELPLPPEAQRQIDNVGRVQRGWEGNKVRDTERQMTGAAVKANLLAQYGPGYAKQIHAAMAKYGFGENALAANLRATLNEQRAANDKQATQMYNWENQNRDIITKLMPNYWDIPRETRLNSPQLQDKLNSQIGAYNREKLDNDQLREKMKIVNGKENIADFEREQQERLATREMNLDLAANFTGFMNTQFGMAATNDPSKAINEFFNNPNNLTPDSVQKVGFAVTQFEDSYVRGQVQKYMQMPVKGLPGETVGGLMGVKKVEELARAQLAPITGEFKKSLSEGGDKAKFSILESNVRFNQAYEAKTLRDIRDRYPNSARMEQLVKMYGPLAGEFISSEPDLKKGVKTELSKEALMWKSGVMEEIGTGTPNNSTGKPFVLSEAIDDYARLKIAGEGRDGKPMPPRAADMESLMNQVYSNIMNTKAPDQAVKNYATSVFSDPRLLPQIRDSEKMNFLRKWTGPEMGERIYKLGDQKLILDYKTFITNGVTAAANHLAGDTRDVQSFRDFSATAGKLGMMADLKYNPETNRVEGNVPTPQDIRARATNPTVAAVLEAQSLKAKDTISGINSVLGVMEPVFSRDGPASVPAGLMSTLIRLGIPVQMPAESGTGKKTEDTSAPPTAAASSGGTKTTSISSVGQAFETLLNDPSGKVTFQGQEFDTNYIKRLLTKEPSLLNRNSTLPDNAPPEKRSETTPDELATKVAGGVSPDIMAFADESRLPSGARPAAYTPAQEAIDKALGETGTTATVPARNAAMQLITRAEGTSKAQGYNTVFGGGTVPLTKMSINEVIAAQMAAPKNNRAAGIAQFMPQTLKGLVKEMGLTGNEKMDENMQDAMFNQLLERRGLSQWREGKISDEKFIDNLAKEWAGLPNTSGKSAHQGVAGNKNTVPLRDVYKMLDELRGNVAPTGDNRVQKFSDYQMEHATAATKGLRINPENFQKMLDNSPPPENPVEDRRTEHKGLLKEGNIVLSDREVVRNKDGSISTVKSISIGTPQGEVLIPTVIGGKIVTDKEAIAHFKKTGEHLGVFATPEDATAYAKFLSQDMERIVKEDEDRRKRMDQILLEDEEARFDRSRNRRMGPR